MKITILSRMPPLGAAGLTALALIFAAAAHGGLLTHDFAIAQSEIQAKVDAMSPIHAEKLFMKLELPDPKVSLIKATSEIELASSANLELPKIPGANLPILHGRATITGSLRYDADAGAFYFDHPSIKSLDIERLPEKYKAKATELAQAAASKYLSTHPVYVLKDANLKHKLAKAVLKSVRVQGETIVATLGL